ncbi:MAG: hypothetical protein IIV87_05205, partial [Oscillospiraceae bacterium]|nr:hypothetical protein [Oscillospiraceae bacterium]
VFCNAFFRFYLSDMLWGLALGLGLMAIYDPIGKGAWLCAGAAVICGCVWEFAQWTKLVHGTGDILDVFMYLLGGFFSIIMNRNVRRKK